MNDEVASLMNNFGVGFADVDRVVGVDALDDPLIFANIYLTSLEQVKKSSGAEYPVKAQLTILDRNKVSFITGWMVKSNGLLLLNTPFGGK